MHPLNTARIPIVDVVLIVCLGSAFACGQSDARGSGSETVSAPTTIAATARPPAEAPAPTVAPPVAPTPSFTRFLLVADEAGCPPQANGDCHSEAELRRDGTFRLDPWGEPGAPPLSAQVEPTALAAAVDVLRADDVSSSLAPGQACPEANTTESMRLEDGGRTVEAKTGHCNGESVMRARRTLIDLCTRYFPGHSLVSPPF